MFLLGKQSSLKVFLERFLVPNPNKTFPVLATTFKPSRSGRKIGAQESQQKLPLEVPAHGPDTRCHTIKNCK